MAFSVLTNIKKDGNLIFKLLVILYFSIGILSISYFPPVFTDEPWGDGGIPNNFVKTGRLSHPSFPNADYFQSPLNVLNLKYLLISIPISVFGYNSFGIRIFSFLCFSGFLFLFYKSLKHLYDSTLAFAITAIISIHPFCINSSHICRSESFILFLSGIVLYLSLFWKTCKSCIIKNITIGFILSIALLAHPVGGLVVFSAYLGFILVLKASLKTKFLHVLQVFSGALPITAIFCYYFLISIRQQNRIMPIGEIYNWNLSAKLFSYGRILFSGFDLSGAFYLPLIVCILALIISCCAITQNIIKTKQQHSNYALFPVIFIILLCMIFLASRYSRLYLVYFAAWGLPAILIPIYFLKKKTLFWIFMITLGLFFTFQDIAWLNFICKADYVNFENRLRTIIPSKSVVLGKINYGLSFNNCEYYASEDLIYYYKKGGTIQDYIKKYDIEYIVYDCAWDTQSKKGNLDHGTPYEETKKFFKDNTTIIAEITDNYYSNRFGPEEMPYIFLPYGNLIEVTLSSKLDKEYWVHIYKVIR